MSRSQSTTRWALPYCKLFCSFIFNCCYNFMIFPITWTRKVRSGTTRNNACAELIFFLVQLYLLYWLLCILHTETYVFQCTGLGNFLRHRVRRCTRLQRVSGREGNHEGGATPTRVEVYRPVVCLYDFPCDCEPWWSPL